MNPAEILNQVPIHTELTILGPDDPNQRKLNWKFREKIGTEVRFASHPGNGIYERQDLKVGSEIVIPHFFGRLVMKVTGDETGNLWAETGDTLAALTFDDLDRHCWICSGLINKKGLTKLTLEVDPNLV